VIANSIFSLEKWFERKVKKVEGMRRKEAGIKRERPPEQEGIDRIAEKMERRSKSVSIHLWDPAFTEENYRTDL